MYLIPSHLSTNTVLELLVLTFMLVNVIVFLAPGLMKEQLSQVIETRNVRTFDQLHSKYYLLRALLMLQFFLFVGLHIFLMLSAEPAAQLQQPDGSVWRVLVKCVAFPVGWFVAQQLLFNWWSLLFTTGDRVKIMNRVYLSIHIVVAPLILLTFLLEMIGLVEVQTATYLLSLSFIMIQIMFIYSGIKIFLGGWSTLCFLFLYLCTLEIAPLVMIYQLLTR